MINGAAGLASLQPHHSDLIAPLVWLAFFKEPNDGLSYKSFSL
jgi:hypothetical protein